MKKIIITLTVFILSFLGVSANSENLDREVENELNRLFEINDDFSTSKKNNSNNLNVKIFRLKNKKLEKKIQNLDTEILEHKNKNKKLVEENKILINKNESLNGQIMLQSKKGLSDKSIDYSIDKIFENYSDKLIINYYSVNEDDRFLYVVFLYLLISLIIFFVFIIFTLPLRLLRGIWRIFTGYKNPCANKSNEREFNKLIKKYNISEKELNKLKNTNNNLTYEIGKLKSEISKNKNKNKRKEINWDKINYKTNDFKKKNILKKEKTNDFDNIFGDFNLKNKEEEVFVFEELINKPREKFSLSNNKKDDKVKIEKKSEEKFDLLEPKTNSKLKIKESFLNLNSKNLESNKKKEKFNLFSDKNKKSKLFE